MISKKTKIEMINQGLTIKKLSTITGYSPSHLSNIIAGRLDSLRVKKVIALALHKNYEDLWCEAGDGSETEC